MLQCLNCILQLSHKKNQSTRDPWQSILCQTLCKAVRHTIWDNRMPDDRHSINTQFIHEMNHYKIRHSQFLIVKTRIVGMSQTEKSTWFSEVTEKVIEEKGERYEDRDDEPEVPLRHPSWEICTDSHIGGDRVGYTGGDSDLRFVSMRLIIKAIGANKIIKGTGKEWKERRLWGKWTV